MRIIRNIFNCPEEAKKSAIALGNFDGVHLGHQAIINKAKAKAVELKIPSAVLTFEPHPRVILSPEKNNLHLTNFKQKVQILKDIGIDYLFLIRFNNAFSNQSSEVFITEILYKSLNAQHIVVGEDFTFGSKRRGNTKLLKSHGKELNFTVDAIDDVKFQGRERYSSSSIKNALKKGNIETANQQLSRPFTICGRVKKGDQIGRTIGFPTANLLLKKYVRPKYGVYAGYAIIDKKKYDAAINIGIRPSLDKNKELLEVYLIDQNINLYDKNICVTLEKFIRNEIKFAGIDELKMQISQDVEKCRELLKILI